MEANEGSPDWGTVTPAEDCGQPSLLVREGWSTGDGSTTYSVWQPPEDLKSHLPEEFGLPFRVHVGPDGLRRVAPLGSVERHLIWAWQGGFAILCRHRQLGPEQRQSYRLMWFLYQKVRRMREHLRRSFNWSRDLSVTRSSRLAPEERSVIPTLVKRESEGEYVRPKVSELRDRGYEAARAAGINKPRPDQAIHFGLVSYAKDDPLSIPDDKVP
jgi:hypothetical protein